MAYLTPTAHSGPTERERTHSFIDRIGFGGLLIAIVALPLAYDRSARDPFTLPKRCVIAGVLTGIATLVIADRLRRGISLNRAHMALAAVAISGALSSVLAASHVLAIEGMFDVVFIALPGAVAGSLLISTPRRVLLCANALGAAAFLVAAIGILQHQNLDWWGYRPSPESARGQTAPPSPDLLAAPIAGAVVRGAYALLDGCSRPGGFGWAGPFASTLDGIASARLFSRLPTVDGAASVFGHPNVAAEVVAAGWIVLFVATLAAWTRARTAGSKLVGAVFLALRMAALITMGFYLFVTGTRGAWVGLAVAGFVLMAALVLGAAPGRRLRTAGVVIACAAILGASAWFAAARISVPSRGGGAPTTLLERFQSFFDRPEAARDTVRERRVLWANTHAMLLPRADDFIPPLVLGVGPGNWQVRYPLHHRAALHHEPGTYTLHRYPDHAHQDGLELLAEFGVVGAGLFSVFLATALSRLVRAARSPSQEVRSAALVLIGLLAAVLSVSFFSFPLHLAPLLMMTFLSLGAALALPDEGAPALRAVFSGLVFAGFAALGGFTGAWMIGGAAAALVLAALPWDRILVLGPAGSRALAITAASCSAIAILGSWSRLEASESFQAALDHAWSARSVPGQSVSSLHRARAAFDRATAAAPADFLAEMARADFLSHAGFLADAEASARRALVVHPFLINARVELAWLSFKRGDDEGAMREARAARSLNQDAPEPRLLLGELFTRQGRDELALDEFDHAIELSPKGFQPYGKIRAAEIRMAGGEEAPRALADLAEAQNEAAENADMLARIATIYEAAGAVPGFQAKAATVWRRVLALNPEHARARTFLAANSAMEAMRSESRKKE